MSFSCRAHAQVHECTGASRIFLYATASTCAPSRARGKETEIEREETKKIRSTDKSARPAQGRDWDDLGGFCATRNGLFALATLRTRRTAKDRDSYS